MPIFESSCVEAGCHSRGRRVEWYASTSDKADPSCRECGTQMTRLVSSFGVVWARPFSFYNDKSKDNSQMDEHTVWRKRSTRRADGQPEIVRITNRQEQLEYIKAEGLEDPAGINPNAEPSADGMSMQTKGVKGQWI